MADKEKESVDMTDEELDAAGDAPVAEQPIVRVTTPKAGPNETIPGGKYLTRAGRWVNAHGQTIDQDGNVQDGSTPVVITPPASGAKSLG